VAVETVRGQQALFQGSGLYRYDPVELAGEGRIWDAINLFIGLPLFVAAVLAADRGSLRGKLILAGLLFYFLYVYLMYAMMMSLNPLFPVYVAVFSLCGIAFLRDLAGWPVAELPARISERFPRRLFVGYAFVFSAALIILWGKLILTTIVQNAFPTDLTGMNTLETQALDLGMIVPLALGTGILLWRRSVWGYFLAGICVTQGMMMFIAIPVWIAVPLIQSGSFRPLEAVPFLALCLVGLTFTGLFCSCVREDNR
jgi:hypothetical protein